MPDLKLFSRRIPTPALTADASRTLDSLLHAAVQAEASDLHCEPKTDGLCIRFRIDGEMREHTRLPVSERDALLARGKIFGGMDITEKRLPQDGRAVWVSEQRRFHLRLSTVPTVHGESLVIRLLDQQMPSRDFADLGFSQIQSNALAHALAGPAGLILLTGPTGSGKTTSLHAALQALDHQSRVIHTLEEPVEYEFPGIRQTEIREKIGLTFASALRALLRQNPDVMLVGETRDNETAQLAVRAALTGHVVLSTLHTNDALAAIPRLRDLGTEAFLLAASLRLVAAQRLVRRLCPECKRPHRDLARLADLHGLPDAKFCQPRGCPGCAGRGYRGRLAIHEVIPMEKFLPLIAAEAPQSELTALRESEGIATLWQHGLAAAGTGLTTLEEVTRVL
ncbi:MAG: type II/IV secretion system protein [Opitutaceae bacterium]|nr:type II/IV secretion system protein [Cephaloticoccus sp.]MCP5530465.1 type II/IV secretion system protein [Opitutaceae bacterium]